MKHETLNSIIALLGLGLAAVTAWQQFGPKSDSLSVVNEGRVDLGRMLDIASNGNIDPLTGESLPVLGPITWKIRVHNLSPHTVAIVSFDAFL